MSERCRCALLPLAEPATAPAPPISAEDLASLLDDGNCGEGQWHIVVRRNGVTALCGFKCSRDCPKPADAGDDDDCKACERILQSHLNGGGWEGAGRKPGRDLTEELRYEWEAEQR